MPDLNTIWKKADPEAAGGVKKRLPDGTYDCTLQNVCIMESKRGNTGVAWNFTDNRSGEAEFKWNQLRVNAAELFEDDAGWLKRDMGVLGLHCNSFDEVEHALQTIIGATVRLEIETKPGRNGVEWRNIKITEKLADPVRTPGGDVPVDNDDDIPF